jgi:putative transposase
MKKQYTPKQKSQIVLEIFKEEKTVAQIASEYSVHSTQLYKWKNQAIEGLPTIFEDQQKAQRDLQAAHDQQLQELYAEIGKLNTQLAWLKKKSGLELLQK